MSAASEAHGAIASGPALAARIEGFGSDHTYSAGRPRPITATRACYNPASDALVVGSAGIVATVLTLLGAFTRLWRLDSPATPIYDETHVGRFLNWYHEGAYFFDVHPPLAKLGMFWIARALGYTGRASCPYEETAPYAAECALAPQRLLPALCGAALVPLTFATACVMRLHPLAATLGAWVVLVDPLWIGLSRVHLNDMVQMLFIALTHYFAIRACASSTTPQEPTTTTRQLHSASKDAPIDLQTLVALTAAGVSLGCALQCKFAMALTTLGWLGLQNLWTLAQHLALRRRVRALLCQAAVRGERCVPRLRLVRPVRASETCPQSLPAHMVFTCVTPSGLTCRPTGRRHLAAWHPRGAPRSVLCNPPLSCAEHGQRRWLHEHRLPVVAHWQPAPRCEACRERARSELCLTRRRVPWRTAPIQPEHGHPVSSWLAPIRFGLVHVAARRSWHLL